MNAGTIKRALKRAISIILLVAFISTFLTISGFAAPAPDNERIFDIGMNHGNVTAELSDEGLLTLAGAGDTQNYTAETAPFAHKAEEIKAIAIGGAITSIGDYLFYNLKNITGEIVLPEGLIYIGEKAFSGDSAEAAPHPRLVINEFEESEIAVENDGTSEAESGLGEDEGASFAEGSQTPEEIADSIVNDMQNSGSQRFSIVRITEQEIAGEVFFPFEENESCYIASTANLSFVSAAEDAGMRRADMILDVAFDVGEGESTTGGNILLRMPVINGEITLPELPYEFGGAEGDAMFEYTFRGWTEALDEADVVREAGSEYSIAERGEQSELYFIASWDTQAKIGISVMQENDLTIYEIEQADGYAIKSTRWQMGETDYATGEVIWTDLPDIEGTRYERISEAGDEHRQFRAVINVEKESFARAFFSLFSSEDTGEEVTLAAVMGAPVLLMSSQEVSMSFGANSGSGSMESLIKTEGSDFIVPLCDFTRSGYVFGGWEEDGTGTHRDPGDVLTLDADLLLNAKWISTSSITVITATTATQLTNAFSSLPSSGTFYTNYIVMGANLKASRTLPAKQFTITSVNPITGAGTTRRKIAFDWSTGEMGTGDPYGSYVHLQASARFENIELCGADTSAQADIFAGGHILIIGDNVVGSGRNRPNYRLSTAFLAPWEMPNPGQNGSVRVFSGNYETIYGHVSYSDVYTGTPEIVVAGSATVSTGIAGTGNNAGTVTGGSKIVVGGNAQVNCNVYGGGNVAKITQNTSVVITDDATITGDVFGAGIGSDTKKVTDVEGNSKVKISGGTINGSVYGGGNQSMGKVLGNASIEILSGAITGNVYGGGNLGTVGGSTSVTVRDDAEIGGDVYAGGNSAAVSGAANLKLEGGNIAGRAFGGGNSATVNSARVEILGDASADSVFTGGNGAAATIGNGTPAPALLMSGGNIGRIYGGGNLAAVRSSSVSITGGTVGNVYGGGFEGAITTGSNVTISNATVTENVYGGGDEGPVPSTYVVLNNTDVGGNVYGGGEHATVTALANPNGGTPVQVIGGSVAGSVFGGGQNGDVGSGSGVTISGGAQVGSVYGGGESAAVSGSTSVTINGATVNNKIYGGGQNGSVSETTVAVTNASVVGTPEGYLSGQGFVFGGGEGTSATITNASSKTSVLIDDSTVYGTVYGGGNAGVVPAAEVIVQGGSTVGEVNGGGNVAAVSGAASLHVENSTILRNVYGGGTSANVNTALVDIINSQIGEVDAERKGNLYAGGEGATAGVQSGTPNLTIINSAVTGSVHGGGDLGNVQSTNVILRGESSVGGDVFGGCRGSEGENNGSVAGNTNVRVYNDTTDSPTASVSIGGDVYGGGDYGSVGGSATVTLETAKVSKTAYAGGNRGEVSTNTKLILQGGTIGQNAYGGSLRGDVGGNSSLEISGGIVGRNAFGGSKGAPESHAIGAVAGSASVSITGGTIGEKGFVSSNPEESGNLIAAGEYAAVTGDASVIININDENGGIATSVYGGGFYAPVGTSTAGGTSTISLIKGMVGAQIYGGGYGSLDAVVRKAVVDISGGTVGASVYGGGALGIVTGIGTDATVVNVSGGTINGNVFGAGQGMQSSTVGEYEFGRVMMNTNVNISGGRIKGIVFGGGDFGDVGDGTVVNGAPLATPSATISTNIHMTDGTVDVAVFGGGSGIIAEGSFADGVVFGHTNVLIEKGYVGRSVWGGSNRSYVTGNTKVIMNPTLGDIQLDGTVYGGSNIPGGENPVYRDDVFLVLGTSGIYINGKNGSNTMNLTGSIYGGGNLTTVAGVRTVFIENYTGEIESIQRAENVYIRNSNFHLYGANDVTEAAVRYYSIAVVEHIYIANGSTVTVDKEVRQLAAMTAATISGSYPNFSAPVPHTAETNRNTFSIYQGRILQIKNKNNVFGKIEGIFWLDILTDEISDEYGVTIQASLDSKISADGNPAQAPADTGAFIRAMTPSGGRLPLQSGKTSSYAYWRLGSAASVIDLTIRVPHSDNGGTGVAVQEFDITTSSEVSIYKIEEPYEIVESDGTINMVLPEMTNDEPSLPAFNAGSGQNRNNTFVLGLDAVGDEDDSAWQNRGSPIYFSTQAANKTAPWKKEAEGVWRYGEEYPTSKGEGVGSGANGSAEFTVLYEPDFRGFVNSKVRVTLKEYEDEIHTGTIYLNLTIQGEESTKKVQTADITKGKVFEEIYNEVPQTVEINNVSSVSSFFTTVYYPESPGASNMSITLLDENDEESVTPIAFPYGTKLTLADMNDSHNMSYYSVVAVGGQRMSENSISLASFVSLGTGVQAHYGGPSDNTVRITEKILIVADFSEVDSSLRLPAGEYSLCLQHSPNEEYVQKAGFAIAENEFSAQSAVSVEKIDIRKIELTLTQHVPPQETRDAQGSEFIIEMFTAAGMQAPIFPTATFHTDEGVVFINSDGTLTVKTSATNTRLTVDFSQVSQDNLPGGEYKFKTNLVQLDLPAETDSTVVLENGGAGGSGGIQDYPQAVKLEVANNIDRLLDVSENSAQLAVDIRLAGLVAGDTISAEILKKMSTQQSAPVYDKVSSASSWISLSGDGNNRTATITVPKGTTAGTYRLAVKVKNANSVIVTEAVCNFIIK